MVSPIGFRKEAKGRKRHGGGSLLDDLGGPLFGLTNTAIEGKLIPIEPLRG